MVRTMRKTKKLKAAANKIAADNGIVFEPDIGYFSSSKHSDAVFSIISLIISFISALSVVYMLDGFLEYKANIQSGLSVAAIAAVTTVCVFMTTKTQSFFKGVGIAGLIVNTLYVLTKLRSAVSGFMYAAYVYCIQAKSSDPLFANMISDVTRSDINVFFITLTFLLSLAVSLSCIYWTSFPFLFIVTFPFFEIGMFWGWEPPIWTIIGLFTSWIVILSLTAINHSSSKKKSKNNFSVSLRKKTFYLTSPKIKRSFFSSASAIILAITAFAFAVSFFIIRITDNYRPEAFTEMRKNISRNFQEITEEIASGGIFPATKQVGGTNGGKLGRYDEISFTGKTALRVTAESFDYPLYLRGYTAENYSDNAWTASEIEEDMRDYFENLGYYQLDYNYLETKYKGSSSSLSESSVTVEIVNADDKYAYAPYHSLYSSDSNIEDQVYDGYISPDDPDEEYTLKTIMFSGSSWSDVLSSIDLTDDQSGFGEYDSYVTSNGNYYMVPESIVQVIDAIIENSQISQYPVSGYADVLRNYLESQGFEYSLSPGVTPQGEDFIGYFLTEQKEGYCTYYASTCVMIMRRLGYPARYVEGYVLDPEQYSSDGSSIRVADRCAHAWCEIFIEGYGWYPVDITPGFENGNPNLIEADKAEKDDSSSELTSDSSSPDKTAISDSAPEESKSDASEHDDPDSSESSSSAGSLSHDSESSSEKTDSDSPAELTSSAEDQNSDATAAAVSGSGGQSGGSSTSGGFRLTAESVYLIIAMFLVLIFAAAVLLRRKRIIMKSEQKISGEDRCESIIECYRQYLRCIELYGIDMSGNCTDKQRCVKIAKQLGELSPGLADPFMKLTDCAVTARMSNNEFTEQDVNAAKETLSEMKSLLYERLSPFRRFGAKYILNIY